MIWILLILVLASSLYAQQQQGYLPGGGHYHLFTITDHHRQAAAIIAQIPPDAKVSAQDRLNPHVAGRETIYIFPRIDDADTIFVDVTGPAWPQHPNDLYATVQALLDTQGFGVAAADDGYLLLRKDEATKQIPAPFYNAFRRPDHSLPTAPLATFGNQLQLVDYAVTTDAHGEVVVQLYWRALQPLTEDLRFYIAYQDADGNVLQDNQFYQPVATLWYPTSMWKVGETILVQSLPWALDADQLALTIGAYAGEDGWSAGKRLTLTNAPIMGYPQFEQNTVLRLGGYHWYDGQWQRMTPLTTLPNLPAMQPRAITVGDTLFNLAGTAIAELPAHGGESLTFTLFWQAGDQPPTFDYALFAQLFDSAGNKVAQIDWQPHDHIGLRPMTTWQPGEVLQDTQTLPLPVDLPAGTYTLLAGVYNWQSGERLPVVGEVTEAGDTIVITTFALK